MKMKRIRILLIGLILIGGLLGGSIGWYLYQKPHDDLHRLDAKEKLSATDLFARFEADEAGATSHFLNQIVAVEGTVAEKNQLDAENVVLLLRQEDALFGVSCAFSGADARAAGQLSEGKTVRLKGVVTGMNMDVNLVRCVLDE